MYMVDTDSVLARWIKVKFALCLCEDQVGEDKVIARPEGGDKWNVEGDSKTSVGGPLAESEKQKLSG